MIHGMPNYLGFLYPISRKYDWTQGCIAVSNITMEEIWSATDVGTPVRAVQCSRCRPFSPASHMDPARFLAEKVPFAGLETGAPKEH